MITPIFPEYLNEWSHVRILLRDSSQFVCQLFRSRVSINKKHEAGGGGIQKAQNIDSAQESAQGI